MVTFTNREEARREKQISHGLKLSDIAFEDARAAAPGWDIYLLEQKWRAWVLRVIDEGGDPPRDADRAFVGFCQKWFETREKG